VLLFFKRTCKSIYGVTVNFVGLSVTIAVKNSSLVRERHSHHHFVVLKIMCLTAFKYNRNMMLYVLNLKLIVKTIVVSV
jgi:hypothetical protein